MPPHFEEHRQATIDYCLKEDENANMMIGTLQVCVYLSLPGLPTKMHLIERSRGGDRRSFSSSGLDRTARKRVRTYIKYSGDVY